MSPLPLQFEDFETAERPEAPPSADFLKGYEAGLADAKQSTEASHHEAVAKLTTCLSDMQFGFAEAQAKLLAELRPLLSQIADTVLPEIAQAAFSAHLHDVLMTSFQSVTDAPVEIAVAPGTLAGLENSDLREIRPFTFVADPRLQTGQARLKSNDQHQMIDLPALVASLQAALKGLDINERTISNG